jgi:ribosomal protein S18 acetylase RimI-like enzyme
MDIPKVKTAGPELQDRILATLQMAFVADPFSRWLMPDALGYLQHYKNFTLALGGQAFEHDTALYTDDFSAAALWFPPGVFTDDDQVAAAVIEVISEQQLEPMMKIGEAMNRCHPDDCWYLCVLGVDVAMQGRGLGASMMKDVLRRCDEEGKEAYLESSSPQNIPFYQRYGFEVMEEISVGNPVPISPMIRQPRS